VFCGFVGYGLNSVKTSEIFTICLTANNAIYNTLCCQINAVHLLLKSRTKVVTSILNDFKTFFAMKTINITSGIGSDNYHKLYICL